MKTHTLKTALAEIKRLRTALQVIEVWAGCPRSDLAEELGDISRLVTQTLEDK